MLFREPAMEKQITNDFQANLALVKTCLYYTTKPVSKNVTENTFIAPSADIWRPVAK